MTATFTDADGAQVGETKTVSVKSYLEGLLALSYEESGCESQLQYQAMQELCVNMLNYGAAAQTYVNHDVENLANAGLTDEQKALATEKITVTDTDKAVNGSAWVGAGVRFDYRLGLYFVFTAGSADEYTATINGTEVTPEAYTALGEGSGDGSGETPDAPPVNLTTINTTVMSFNIRTLTSEDGVVIRQWDSRKDAVCDFILGSGASIIGLNEVRASQYFDLKNGLSDKYEMLWYASYTQSNPQGNAIAYDKSEWTVVGTPEHFWLSPTPDVQSTGWETSHYRSCINALFEHKETGVRLNVFVTHLDHKKEIDMVNGIKLILERMGESEYPVYLCGDFNCTSTSEAYAIAAEALQDAQATALDSDEGTTYNGWDPNTTSTKVIDFCFFSKENVSVKSYEICDGTWGENNENCLSDHNPIVSNVDISCVPFTYPDASGLEGTDRAEASDSYTKDY